MPITVFRSEAAKAVNETAEIIEPVDFSSGQGKVLRLPVGELRPNPAQPRRVFDGEAIGALADSIRCHGILQPLTVRRAEDGGWELISGERRLRAAIQAGLPSVPCLLSSANERESAEMAIIENLQREDLNLFEEAYALAMLIDAYGLTQEEIAHRLSVSQACVANKLRLLRHSEKAKKQILENQLTERHARALLRIKDEETRDEVLGRVIARGLNVAATEAFIESLLSGQTQTIRAKRRYNGVMKDIRLFYNSIDNALDIARRSGVGVTAEKKEEEDVIELTIRIAKK